MAVVKAKYPGTQSELYAITLLAANNLTEDLPSFFAKKAKYVVSYVDDIKALRTEAMSLPDEEARNAQHQVLKNKLPGVMEPCKDKFKDLQGYIRDAWPGENAKPRYESAGLNSYNKIGDDNWEEVVALNGKMLEFIAENSALLIAPGGMPATFEDETKALNDAYNLIYDPYLTSRETSSASAAKLNANNALYDKCMDEFMKDGVDMVFRKDEEKKKRYVFGVLKDIVSPPGSASVLVKVKRADDTFVENAVVSIKKEGQAALTGNTNIAGEVEFKNIDPAKYAGTVTVNGTTTNFTKDVDTGTNARATVVVP